MSVGFGFSVGDFLAVLKLVGTVIDALQDSSNASSSFRSLINELYSLEIALLSVEHLDLNVSHVKKVALQQAASQCRQTIETFYDKIQKYQPHLQPGGKVSTMRDTWMKVKWATCKKDDVETFRAEIRGHTSSLEILLSSIQMEATTMLMNKQDSQYRSLASGIRDMSFQVMGMLATLTGNVAQSVQQGKALLELSAKVVQTNLRIFQMVHDIQLFMLKVPGQIQREQPVYLIDPLNKECPFHLEFVRSPDALLAVLKINLKDSGCGPAMIDRGEFAIEELGTQSLINLTESWDSCFYPGQRVAMSMIFKQWQGDAKSSCPRCGTEHQESTEKLITCNTCGTIFRRIEEVTEETQDAEQQKSSAVRSDQADMLVHGPMHLRKMREEDDVLTNLRKFRRIQVISKSIQGESEKDGPPVKREERDRERHEIEQEKLRASIIAENWAKMSRKQREAVERDRLLAKLERESITDGRDQETKMKPSEPATNKGNQEIRWNPSGPNSHRIGSKPPIIHIEGGQPYNTHTSNIFNGSYYS
ncbi:unnamed protein product [Alternaria alternata]